MVRVGGYKGSNGIVKVGMGESEADTTWRYYYYT